MGRLAAVMGAATLALAGLCGYAPAFASGAVLHGFNFEPRVYSSADGKRGLDLIHEAGAETIRLTISWDYLEPTAPKDGQIQPDPGYVSGFDNVLQSAAARGIRVIAMLHETPCWASSAPDDQRAPCVAGAHTSDYQRYAPTNISDYAAVGAWIAHRWGSQLAALEIWNEPNYTSFLYVNDAAASTDDHITTSDPEAPGTLDVEGADEARTYAQLLQAAYPAIKAQAPHLPVLAGALAYSAAGFLHRLYADGIRRYFDAVSIHPYDNQPGYQRTGNKALSFADGVPLVRREMAAHGDRNKSLWLTEFGWPTCAPSVMDWCVSEDGQASKLIAEFQLIHSWRYVGAAIIYTLVDPGTDPNNFEDNMGLLHHDFSPKPAWNAFVQVMAALGAAPAAATIPPPATAPPPAVHPPFGHPHQHHPNITVAHMARVNRHLLITLVCTARRACRSTIEVMSRGHRHIRVATVTVTLHARARAKRTISLPRWLGRKAVEVVLVGSADAADQSLASAGNASVS